MRIGQGRPPASSFNSWMEIDISRTCLAHFEGKKELGTQISYLMLILVQEEKLFIHSTSLPLLNFNLDPSWLCNKQDQLVVWRKLALFMPGPYKSREISHLCSTEAWKLSLI